MTDKLTEAIAALDSKGGVERWPDIETILEAARRWAEFPTDNDVEALMASQYPHGWTDEQEQDMRAALEAVKREDR